MARLILEKQNLSIQHHQPTGLVSGFLTEQDLLKKRSKAYVECILTMDVSASMDTIGMEGLLKKIQSEFGNASLHEMPLGIVSKCFLGHPFEVHTLDLSGKQIIHHYKQGENLPDPFEKARALALHNAYVMVEVYTNKMVLIREDGTATKL